MGCYQHDYREISFTLLTNLLCLASVVALVVWLSWWTGVSTEEHLENCTNSTETGEGK